MFALGFGDAPRVGAASVAFRDFVANCNFGVLQNARAANPVGYDLTLKHLV
jgi:hypothetical protein